MESDSPQRVWDPDHAEYVPKSRPREASRQVNRVSLPVLKTAKADATPREVRTSPIRRFGAWLHLILDGSASLDPSHALDVLHRPAPAGGGFLAGFPRYGSQSTRRRIYRDTTQACLGCLSHPRPGQMLPHPPSGQLMGFPCLTGTLQSPTLVSLRRFPLRTGHGPVDGSHAQ
jgi:hypothetical protein